MKVFNITTIWGHIRNIVFIKGIIYKGSTGRLITLVESMNQPIFTSIFKPIGYVNDFAISQYKSHLSIWVMVIEEFISSHLALKFKDSLLKNKHVYNLLENGNHHDFLPLLFWQMKHAYIQKYIQMWNHAMIVLCQSSVNRIKPIFSYHLE